MISTARADGSISIELNKLEAVGKGCRIYMVFSNATAMPLTSYKPDLVFFDKNGVIAERLVIEAGPLPAGKTKVKLFDAANLGCASMVRVLLNDVRACVAAGLTAADCLAMTRTTSLSAVEFIK